MDLVCQLGTPRRISTFLQRVGRSGHTVVGTPKGRLFPLTRDELVESTAIIDSVRRGELDRVVGSAYAYVEQWFRPAMRLGFGARFRG